MLVTRSGALSMTNSVHVRRARQPLFKSRDESDMCLRTTCALAPSTQPTHLHMHITATLHMVMLVRLCESVPTAAADECSCPVSGGPCILVCWITTFPVGAMMPSPNNASTRIVHAQHEQLQSRNAVLMHLPRFYCQPSAHFLHAEHVSSDEPKLDRNTLLLNLLFLLTNLNLVFVQGTSPAASLKRERLQNRNAILRRTGFLEGSHGAAFLGTQLIGSLFCCYKSS